MKEIVLLGKIAGVIYGITFVLWLINRGYLNFIWTGFRYVLYWFTVFGDWMYINISLWIIIPTAITLYIWLMIVGQK